MTFKKSPQLPGAGRTRAWDYHGSHTPTSPGAILHVKWPITPNKSVGSVYLFQNCLSLLWPKTFRIMKVLFFHQHSSTNIFLEYIKAVIVKHREFSSHIKSSRKIDLTGNKLLSFWNLKFITIEFGNDCTS